MDHADQQSKKRIRRRYASRTSFPWVWHLDQFAYKLGYKDELARALIRLQIKNLSAMDADWLYSAYNHSHPILVERLRALGYKGGENIFKDEKHENDKIE